MEVWVFLATMVVGGQNAYVGFPDGPGQLRYAFTSKEACEFVIEGSKTLKCIKLEVMARK